MSIPGFPRLSRYLAALDADPGQGLDAFPQLRVKASLLQFATNRQPTTFDLAPLPERLRALLDGGRLVTEWITEVEYHAVTLALWDGHGLDDAAACAFWYDVIRAQRHSKLYGRLLALVTPSRLLRAAPMVWGYFHRGVKLELASAAHDHAVIDLWAPAALWPPLVLRAYASVFYGAVVHRPPTGDEVTIEEDAERTRYRLRW